MTARAPRTLAELAHDVRHLTARIPRAPVVTERRFAKSVPHVAMSRRWADPLYRARVSASMKRARRLKRFTLKPRDPMEQIS